MTADRDRPESAGVFEATGPRACNPANAPAPVGVERAAEKDPSDTSVLDDPFVAFTEWESPTDEEDYAGL